MLVMRTVTKNNVETKSVIESVNDAYKTMVKNRNLKAVMVFNEHGHLCAGWHRINTRRMTSFFSKR